MISVDLSEVVRVKDDFT